MQFAFLSALVVFVFKLVLSFFWLCEEAQCVYLSHHLGSPSVKGFQALFPHAGTLGCMLYLTPQSFLLVYPQANVGLPG